MTNVLNLLRLAALQTAVTQVQTPEEKLETLYKYHLKSRSEVETISKYERFFTPGFLGVLDCRFDPQRRILDGLRRGSLSLGCSSSSRGSQNQPRS